MFDRLPFEFNLETTCSLLGSYFLQSSDAPDDRPFFRQKIHGAWGVSCNLRSIRKKQMGHVVPRVRLKVAGSKARERPAISALSPVFGPRAPERRPQGHGRDRRSRRRHRQGLWGSADRAVSRRDRGQTALHRRRRPSERTRRAAGSGAACRCPWAAGARP